MVGLPTIFTVPITFTTTATDIALDMRVHNCLQNISNTLAHPYFQLLHDYYEKKSNNSKVVIF